MNMWNFLPVGSLINIQRRFAFEKMGQQARDLLAEGYSVEADRVLDEMNERRRSWREEGLGDGEKAA